MQKDCIIGFSSNYDWNILKFWVNSLNKCGFQGDKVLIVGNCDSATIEKLKQNNILVYAAQKINEFGDAILNSDLAPHVERFFYIHDYLNRFEYRYVLTTDVRDVVFQKNPIAYMESILSDDVNLIVSTESIKYQNESWGNKNLLDTFGQYLHKLYNNREIFNVGILAGKCDAIKNLILSIAINSINRQIKICDQAVFNFILWTSNAKIAYSKSEYGWTCNLGTTGDPSKLNDFRPFLLENIPTIVDDMVCVSDESKQFYIVHQYDRNPILKNLIENKYA